MADNDRYKHLEAFQWGHTNEPKARKRYEECYKTKDRLCGTTVSKCGALAATPDGLREDGVLVEIKCPHAIGFRNILEAVGAKVTSICKYLEEVPGEAGVLRLIQSHQYYFQVNYECLNVD